MILRESIEDELSHNRHHAREGDQLPKRGKERKFVQVFGQSIQDFLIFGIRELVQVEKLLVLQVDVREGSHDGYRAEEVLLKDRSD